MTWWGYALVATTACWTMAIALVFVVDRRVRADAWTFAHQWDDLRAQAEASGGAGVATCARHAAAWRALAAASFRRRFWVVCRSRTADEVLDAFAPKEQA